MRYFWSRFIIIVLLIEGCAFALYYQYGPRGIKVLQTLKAIKADAVQHIKIIEEKNNDLLEQIEEWNNNRFLHEKFARENLALQKDHETIYFR